MSVMTALPTRTTGYLVDSEPLPPRPPAILALPARDLLAGRPRAADDPEGARSG